MQANLTAAIRGADAFEFWLLVCVAGVAAVAGAWFAVRWLHRARLVEDIPTSRIRSASQGYVELQGRGELLPGDPISAPLTGLPCVWWAYRIEHLDDSAGRRRRWRTMEQAASDALFVLEDDTGRCVVDPDGAEVLSPDKDSWRGSQPRPPPMLGKARTPGGAGGRYRYCERRLAVGAPLYAIGEFGTQGHASSWDVAEETRLLLAEWKRGRASLLQRFDANRDGEIDLDEWEQARRAARREIEQQRQTAAANPGVHVMNRPADGRPFILAPLPQPRLARGFRLRALAAFAALVTAGAVLATALIARLA